MRCSPACRRVRRQDEHGGVGSCCLLLAAAARVNSVVVLLHQALHALSAGHIPAGRPACQPSTATPTLPPQPPAPHTRGCGAQRRDKQPPCTSARSLLLLLRLLHRAAVLLLHVAALSSIEVAPLVLNIPSLPAAAIVGAQVEQRSVIVGVIQQRQLLQRAAQCGTRACKSPSVVSEQVQRRMVMWALPWRPQQHMPWLPWYKASKQTWPLDKGCALAAA